MKPKKKMRTHIAKALQRHSQTICRALTDYNTEALKLTPPRPELTWKQIVDYSFLAEFDMLWNSCIDIRSELWTQPAHREATIKHLEIERAQEEIKRLNLEIRRVRTRIHIETLHAQSVIDRLQETQPALATELAKHTSLQAMVNAIHIGRLDRIEALDGFSGMPGIGVAAVCEGGSTLVEEVLNGELENMCLVDEEEVERQVEGMTDFMSHITD
jgi:hypothetical protein